MKQEKKNIKRKNQEKTKNVGQNWMKCLKMLIKATKNIKRRNQEN